MIWKIILFFEHWWLKQVCGLVVRNTAEPCMHRHCSLTPSWKMFYWLRFFVTCAFSGLLVKTDRPVFSMPAHEHFILSRTVPLRQHAMFLCLHFAILDMSHISLKNWWFLHWFFWRADILVDNINRFFCAVIEQRILADVY